MGGGVGIERDASDRDGSPSTASPRARQWTKPPAMLTTSV